jgi:hypothetical protein
MAEYKGIHGTKVQDYTTDPDNPITGQVWYNETANTLRVEAANNSRSLGHCCRILVAQALADLNTGRSYTTSSGNTNTDVTTSGGQAGDSPGASYANTELWNGTAWTETTDLSTARGQSGTSGGVAGSAIQAGGNGNVTTVEEWTGAGSPVIRTITTD